MISKSSQKKPRDKAQARRFIKAAREAGASEDLREFEENLRRIATVKPKDKKEADH
jgi:hypothetical protein